MAKRKFSNDNIKYDFASILDSGKKKASVFCVVEVFGDHSLRLLKLMLHLEKVHLAHKHKNTEFFKRKEAV